MNPTVIKGGPLQREDEWVPELMRRENLERAVALFPQAVDLVRENCEREERYLRCCLEEQSGEFILVGWKVGSDSDLKWQRQENAAIGAADFIPPEGLDVRVRTADGRPLPGEVANTLREIYQMADHDTMVQALASRLELREAKG